MERFHLTRLDLMQMSWGELIFLFDATSDDDDEGEKKETRREATPEEYSAWV